MLQLAQDIPSQRDESESDRNHRTSLIRGMNPQNQPSLYLDDKTNSDGRTINLNSKKSSLEGREDFTFTGWKGSVLRFGDKNKRKEF